MSDSGALATFRKAAKSASLKTQSGRFKICTDHIAAFRNSDLLPHPAWYPRTEWLGNAARRHLFQLILRHPADQLRSQLDRGPESHAANVNIRTVADLNPAVAQTLGIANGDLLRVFNDWGACLVSARLLSGLMQGYISICTPHA